MILVSILYNFYGEHYIAHDVIKVYKKKKTKKKSDLQKKKQPKMLTLIMFS